jgi:hypothetical protein
MATINFRCFQIAASTRNLLTALSVIFVCIVQAPRKTVRVFIQYFLSRKEHKGGAKNAEDFLFAFAALYFAPSA